MILDWFEKTLWPGGGRTQDDKRVVTGEFSECSDSELLDTVKTEQWGHLEEEDRVELFQEMENRTADAEGRARAEVMSTKGNYLGCYSPKDNVIELDVSRENSYEVLDTYIHEQNHAMQHYCINNDLEKDGASIQMIQAEFSDYEERGPEYSMQCSEMDSNNQAADFMLSEADRYADDPKYHEYVKERAEHFSKVNTNVRTMTCRRESLHEQQADKALSNGLITEEQHDALLARDQDPGQIDPEVSRSVEMESRFRELDQELENGRTSIEYLDAEPAAETDYSDYGAAGSLEGEAEVADYCVFPAEETIDAEKETADYLGFDTAEEAESGPEVSSAMENGNTGGLEQ